MARKLSPADRAEIAARAGTVTYAELAREFGVARSRIGQVVAEERAVERVELEADLEAAALRARHAHALELVPHVDLEERLALLALVVAPTPAVAQASREAALAQLRAPQDGRRVRVGACPGCGVSFADPPTRGCDPCSWREAKRRRRQRERDERMQLAG